MASFRFALHDTKADGPTRIRLQVRYGATRIPESDPPKYTQKKVTIYFGESVPPECWNQGKQRVKNMDTSVELNGRLSNIKNSAEDAYRSYLNTHSQSEPPAEELKELIRIAIGQKEVEPELGFFGYFNKFVELQRSRRETGGKALRNTNIKDYERTVELLQEFSSRKMKLSFRNIDETFYHSFVKYMRDQRGYNDNTVGKYVKNLKAFMNWARKKKYHENLDYQDFKVLTAISEFTYLSEDELKILANLELNETLDRYRDAILISCWTGLRYSDFSRLSHRHIDYEKKVIRITQQKTRTSTSKPLVIPILPEIQYILLEKYRDRDLPTGKSNQPLNRYLKKLAAIMSEKVEELKITGEKEPKDYSKAMTTHVGRRSFCSNMYRRGIPVEQVMAISGHRTEKIFRGYIRVDNEDRAADFLKSAIENRPVVSLKIAQ